MQEISSQVAQFECNADREISQRLKTTLGQLTSTARLAAVGLVEEAITRVMADAADLMAFTLQQGLFPIVLAGDHSTAAATIAGIRRAHPSDRLGVARRCLEYLAAVDRIYVSFDVDALDSTICKGTGTPVPGGLWADEAEAILRRLLADRSGWPSRVGLAQFAAHDGGQPPSADVRSATKTP